MKIKLPPLIRFPWSSQRHAILPLDSPHLERLVSHIYTHIYVSNFSNTWLEENKFIFPPVAASVETVALIGPSSVLVSKYILKEDLACTKEAFPLSSIGFSEAAPLELIPASLSLSSPIDLNDQVQLLVRGRAMISCILLDPSEPIDIQMSADPPDPC